MSKPVDGSRTYLKIVQGAQSFAACVLQKDKQESCSVDLFLSTREGIQLTLEGGKNELSVIGYFEPEAESESEGEDGMAGFEDSEEESEDVSDDETEGMSAPVDGRIEDLDAQEEESKKKGKHANKKTQALKALQAAAANDEDEDDEEEDGDEDGEGESGEQSEGGSEEGEGEEGSEEEEEDEEESDAETTAPSPKDNKRKAQQQHQQQQQQSNKKAKTQAGGGVASSVKGDEAAYKSALIDFLKKNGPTPLAALGQKVKKPANLPKMAAFLKAHAGVFVVEGGKCSLKHHSAALLQLLLKLLSAGSPLPLLPREKREEGSSGADIGL
ncbi:hypothetical protein Efla_004281 [Eimeria flavescens]